MRVIDQRQRAPWFENLKHRFKAAAKAGNKKPRAVSPRAQA
jgi:hypothetical protein